MRDQVVACAMRCSHTGSRDDRLRRDAIRTSKGWPRTPRDRQVAYALEFLACIRPEIPGSDNLSRRAGSRGSAVGEGQDVIVAVGADVKVVAALVQHVFCGE